MSATASTSPSAGHGNVPALEQGTYEVLRQRLAGQGDELQARLDRLNAERKEVFGAIETTLLATERITTQNKCVPRDLVPIGRNRFLFGYNVHVGLRSETKVADVFALYEHREHQFQELPLDDLANGDFEADFKGLYKYYRNAVFSKFSRVGPHWFMVFQVGKTPDDIKTFKWLLHEDQLSYLGNRSDHEFTYPPQHEFTWKRTHREMHRSGLCPHISIEDRLFVETVGGDLTIKIEDNTDSGQGIYAEPVDNKDQTLDDAEVYYSIIGHLILLKIRPFQEKKFRYFVFNEKLKEVRRIDAIQESCVLLPDGHGIIFPRGCYLQSGEFKQFETQLADMVFDGRVQAPNGEDFLYVFYNRESGDYVLMSYNRIEQRLETPLLCNGFSLFENGELAVFKREPEPQKHHAIQIWRTPYVAPTFQPPVRKDSYLYKIGNPELVSCMAECHELLTLLRKEDNYADLYLDLVKKSGDIIDSYFWLDREDTFRLKEPIVEIRKAATSALEEFDKVQAIRRSTAETTGRLTDKARTAIASIPYTRLNEIGLFVHSLTELRMLRGELVSAKDLRYADRSGLEAVESEVSEHIARLSREAVQFLLGEHALTPYVGRAQTVAAAIPQISKTVEAKGAETDITAISSELEMLVEVVTNLKIDDPTESARIIERISGIFAILNQARSALKQRTRDLQSAEAHAEFSSQSKLLKQSLVNYLDLCDTPQKCDEYVTRLMAQIEEAEGRFADFEEFVIQLSDTRSEVVAAFDARKAGLVEARNKRAAALLAAADRILKAVRSRVNHVQTVDEINGCYASDLMVEKVRQIVQQLLDLGDSVKADELQSRLKSIREEAIRQLKDRQELFVGGGSVIQLGRHQFLTNTQELDLTMVRREEGLFLHLIGTNFFERIENPELLQTKEVWNQEVVSENRLVYRAEFLAYRFFHQLGNQGEIERACGWTDEERSSAVRQFMSARHEEGYLKGVHDTDAAHILSTLLDVHQAAGLLRYHPEARACAQAFWMYSAQDPNRPLLQAKLEGLGALRNAFSVRSFPPGLVEELSEWIGKFCRETGLFDEKWSRTAGEYLVEEVGKGRGFVVSGEAAELVTAFEAHLRSKRGQDAFVSARAAVGGHFSTLFQVTRAWINGFLEATQAVENATVYLSEATVLLLTEADDRGKAEKIVLGRTMEGMTGNHGTITEGRYQFDYLDFVQRLRDYETGTVPLFETYQRLKKELLHRKRMELRLDEFKPRVLTSFVRNRLIDTVYLPLIGANLAKQIGAAGESKRTDLMGMLLLISPPGYGKTTLMEYIAHRLGLIFMKINGPAIGDRVTSLDPAEAPNKAAREEMEKLNLALEMGDNVMLYLDDIQHCHPELLQKFISLCDAQRRIEGVYRGRARTYDLRGRKVAVVMAGNPYTESGEKFKIPDMLANRADTYNLGDIIGNSLQAFKASYLENAVTSNPVLSALAHRSQRDVYPIIQLAETGSRDGLELEGNYTANEINEFVALMQKLIRVRDVILRVNEEYIRSAAQTEAYRTEPPFKLQGSYRNMNRLAEKILPIMNDAEIDGLLQDHYKSEAQTLTTGAEANLLKFKELTGKMTPEESARWTEIKKTFRKNLLFRSGDGNDPVGQVVQQLSAFNDGLESIREVLGKDKPTAAANSVIVLVPQPAPVKGAPEAMPVSGKEKDKDGHGNLKQVSISEETLRQIWHLIELDARNTVERAAEPNGETGTGNGKQVQIEVPKAIGPSNDR